MLSDVETNKKKWTGKMVTCFSCLTIILMHLPSKIEIWRLICDHPRPNLAQWNSMLPHLWSWVDSWYSNTGGSGLSPDRKRVTSDRCVWQYNYAVEHNQVKSGQSKHYASKSQSRVASPGFSYTAHSGGQMWVSIMFQQHRHYCRVAKLAGRVQWCESIL